MLQPEPAGSCAEQRICARPVVLFDFDGVLVRGDAFSRWLRHRFAIAWWLIIPLVLMALVTFPAASTLRGRGVIVRWVVTLALVGLDETTYRVSARECGQSIARDPRRLSSTALCALKAHRDRGDRVLVVTGCEETLAHSILEQLGLASIELVASRVVQGRLGLRIAVRNVGREKIRQLALRDIHPLWDVAYSDSPADLPMLEASRSAVLVNLRGADLARVKTRLGDRSTMVNW